MIRGVTDKIHQLPIFFADTSVNRKDIPVYKKCLLREHDIIYIYIFFFSSISNFETHESSTTVIGLKL